MKTVLPSSTLPPATSFVTTAPEFMPDLWARCQAELRDSLSEQQFKTWIKPLEAIHLTYLPRPVDELTHAEVDDLLDHCEGLVCWTVGRTAVFQRRERIQEPRILASLFAAARRRLWNHTAAHSAHLIDQFIADDRLRTACDERLVIGEKLLRRTVEGCGIGLRDAQIGHRPIARAAEV